MACGMKRANAGTIALMLLGLACAAAEPEPHYYLRFSPNGEYVLAQDGSRIAVLAVQPFHVLFRIPAEGARRAEFTPDSREIVLIRGGISASSVELALAKSPARVERWSVSEHLRLNSIEVAAQDCPTLELAPDGRSLVAVDFRGTLRIIDVSSGGVILENRSFGRQKLDSLERPVLRSIPKNPAAASVHFSPDSQYVLAFPIAYSAVGSTVICNLHDRAKVDVKGQLKKLEPGYSLAFVAPDRIVLQYYLSRETSVVAFPSGRVLGKVEIPQGFISRAADPRFVLVTLSLFKMGMADGSWERTWGDPGRVGQVCAVELDTGRGFNSDAPALDVYGNQYVAERPNGQVGLYTLGSGLQGAVSLDAP